jgi:ATP phosphoribosyltransferase
MSNRLRLALQKKGRLSEESLTLLQQSFVLNRMPYSLMWIISL